MKVRVVLTKLWYKMAMAFAQLETWLSIPILIPISGWETYKRMKAGKSVIASTSEGRDLYIKNKAALRALTVLFWLLVYSIIRGHPIILRAAIVIIILMGVLPVLFPDLLDAFKFGVKSADENIEAYKRGLTDAELGVKNNPFEPGSDQYGEYNDAYEEHSSFRETKD